MKLLPLFFGLPLLCAPALAGGVDRTQIDAQAKWLAHVDLEALHKTQFFAELKLADKEGGLERGLAELSQTEGIELFDDLFSITAYGTSKAEESAVVILVASAKVEPALKRWQDKTGARPVTLNGRTCIEWDQEHGGGLSWLSVPTGSERRQMVLSKTAAGMQQAMDVLDHKRPSLNEQPESDLFAPPTPGTFAFVAASGLLEDLKELEQLGEQSKVAQLAKGVRVEIGEFDSQVFLDLRVRTERPEDALKIKKVGDGLLALVSLVGQEPEQTALLERVSQAITLEAQGEHVHLRFKYGAHALFEELKTLEELDKEKHEANESKHEKHEKKSEGKNEKDK